MPIATSLLLAGAALAVGVGSAVKGTIDAAKQAKAAKKAAAAQKQALIDANAKKPTKTTGADIKLISRRRDDERRRGKGSLAQRSRAAALGGLGTQSASAIGGL